MTWRERNGPRPPRQQDKGVPTGRPPKIEAKPPRTRSEGRLRLRLVITLTFVGDVGAIFAAVSVVVNTPLPVTALLVLALATARVNAYFRVLAAGTALTLTTAFHDPATTDARTASLNEEKPR